MRGISRLAFWALLIVTIVLPSCGGYINNPVPTLLSLDPSSKEAQSPQFTLTLTGNNFTPSSYVYWQPPSTFQPITLQAIFISVNKMTVMITPQLIQNPGIVTVSVFTPQPGGGTSPTQDFTITPRPSPTPVITSISPTIANVGASGVNVLVTGTGFVTESVVEINGTNLTTTVNNSTSIQVTVPSTYLTTAAPVPIAVLNPSPGGGLSNVYNLTLNYPVPSIATLSPTAAVAGGAAVDLTVNGAGLTLASTVLVNGTPRTTIPGGPAEVTGKLLASDMTGGGLLQITVSNPAPGGGTSNIVAFPVNPTASLGLPSLVDMAYSGSSSIYAINGICGTLPVCETLSNGLEPLITSGPSVSQTGQFVVFASTSDNLVQFDASPQSQIFYRNTCLGGGASCSPLTTIVSLDPDGNPANGPSAEPSTDTGGGHVAFSSLAQNLVTSVSVSGKYRQVYWTIPCTSATGCTSVNTELVSISADGTTEGNGDSYDPVISPDGRYVAFVSVATNLASNVAANGVTPQVYVTDTCDGVTTAGCSPTTYLVSTPDGTTPGGSTSSHPSVSSGGTFVAFTSTSGNLGPQAPNPNGVPNVFVRQVCYLSTTCVGSTSLVSTPDGVTPANSASDESTISSDGRFIAFESTATNLIIPDGPTQQIYLRDTCLSNTVTTSCTPTTYLVSTSDGTTPGNALSENPSLSTSTTTTTSTTGLLVAFASQATNLSPNTANGVENIFARNTCLIETSTTTTTCTTSTVLVSQPGGLQPPPSNGNSLRPAIGGQGHVAAFLSFSSNLVANDTNGANGIGDIFLGTTTF